MRPNFQLIAVAALVAGTLAMPAAAGSRQHADAAAEPSCQHQGHGQPAGGCCDKQNSREAATNQTGGHEHAALTGEDAVIQVVRAWLDAIPTRDTARIAPLLADDFVAILPDGRRRVKSEHLKEVAEGTYAVQALSMDEPSVRFFGGVAVITYYQGEESRTFGQDTSGSSVWTDVLVNRDGKWQIVAEHGSRFK